MKLGPIEPATLAFDRDGTPSAPLYGDVYHARAGALEQARSVFLKGNDLPTRWQGRARFVILETGFGLGQNFLATWQAWRQDPHRCDRLWFISVDKHPVALNDARRALAVHGSSELADQAQQLLAVWPAASPDLHQLEFEEGRVVLQVLHADAAVGLRELRLQADALFLDGFSPQTNPDMWSPPVFKALSRLMAPDSTAATWCAARAAREGLTQAGFAVEQHPGFAGKRTMIRAHRIQDRARAPGLRLMHDAAGAAPIPSGEATPVVIVGAGLAGAACAAALQRAGVSCRVVDAATQPAAGASGNPAGLFHGVLHPEDGTHARWGRAAAWMALRRYAPLIRQGLLAGAVDGLLRREDTLDLQGMQRLVQRLGLPSAYVQALEAGDVRSALGPAGFLEQPCWLYPGGGWLDPGAWVAQMLDQPGITFKGSTTVAGLSRDKREDEWVLRDPQGRVIARAQQVVLCNAAAVRDLLPPALTAAWPVGLQRGQITRVPSRAVNHPPLQRPLSGNGYALSLPNGDLLCGATATNDDSDPQVRLEDHRANLERLAGLLGWSESPVSESLGGRVAWRFHADDRLPLVGPVGRLDGQAPPVNATRLREMPREPGLFMASGLGSRGITWAPLVGAVIASHLTGQPPPLPGSLLDALDPRRFALKQARKQGAAFKSSAS
ncbi:MAG: FAD-dependent 5-carboxymethylaminomethyl-2-thiouridine(34) oxidoreductase MnmC [Burkholderiaceae bacterium]